MKKFTALLFSITLIVGCGSNQPASLVHTHQPILNIEADANAVIEAEITTNSAWIKNKTDHNINIDYQLFWYDKLGVTQQHSFLSEQKYSLMLQANEQYTIPLTKPTAESQNYRLYIRLK